MEKHNNNSDVSCKKYSHLVIFDKFDLVTGKISIGLELGINGLNIVQNSTVITSHKESK